MRFLRIFIFCLFLVLPEPSESRSGGSFDHSNHGDSLKTHHWSAPVKAAKRKNSVAKTELSLIRGKKLYLENCAECHGADGKGNDEAVNSMETELAYFIRMVGTHTDGDLAWKIAHGRGEMPSWESVLSETGIWDLVNFIRTLGPAELNK